MRFVRPLAKQICQYLSLPVTWSNKFRIFGKTLVKQMILAKNAPNIHLLTRISSFLGKFIFVFCCFIAIYIVFINLSGKFIFHKDTHFWWFFGHQFWQNIGKTFIFGGKTLVKQTAKQTDISLIHSTYNKFCHLKAMKGVAVLRVVGVMPSKGVGRALHPLTAIRLLTPAVHR